MLPITCANLNPVSEAYCRRTREARYGKRLEELSPIGPQREEHWKRVQEAFGAVASLLEGKKFVLGDTISFADVTIASWVLWIKRSIGDQSQEWKDIEEWNGGRWPTYIAQFTEYEKVIA
jgi:glutathione S-transferase